MTAGASQQLSDLLGLISDRVSQEGSVVLTDSEQSSQLLIHWICYLKQTEVTGTCDFLLDASLSATREFAFCLSLGLVRPALNAMRLQIDLLLAWLYFKDHPVEWNRVQTSGDGFKLKKELLQYLADTCPKFGTRFGLLKDCKSRSTEDPYRLLSAHIHGQSEQVLPSISVGIDVVGTKVAVAECIELQKECSEYLSDVVWSVFGDKWAGIPDELCAQVNGRFVSQKMKAAFYS